MKQDLVPIALFEPGCISCCECGAKPEDPWDLAPEGFEKNEHGDIYCEYCYEGE